MDEIFDSLIKEFSSFLMIVDNISWLLNAQKPKVPKMSEIKKCKNIKEYFF